MFHQAKASFGAKLFSFSLLLYLWHLLERFESVTLRKLLGWYFELLIRTNINFNITMERSRRRG